MTKRTRPLSHSTRAAASKAVPLLGALGLALGAGTGCDGGQPVEPADVSRSAMASNEGTFEYAFDAPFRIEPVTIGGETSYGAIPIILTFHDVDVIGHDAPGRDLRELRHVTVTEQGSGGPFSRTYHLDDLAEIEASLYWRNDGTRPPSRICEPWREDCSDMASLSGTAEWHALLWYAPQGATTEGTDLRLTVEAVVGSFVGPDLAIEAGDLTLTNHLTVHLGEAPMPRFGEGWAYGDLHYHSQGTDNEGESAYSFRAVVRAAGAMGLDFVFTTDHASNSEQLVDLDGPRWDHDTPFPWGVEKNYRGLRDVSPERFRFSLDRVNDSTTGANAVATVNPLGILPQSLLGHGVVPQIYVGGEVDAIPEVGAAEMGSELYGSLRYGNGLLYPWADAADIDAAWYEEGAVWLGGYDLDYDSDQLVESTPEGSFMIRDRQGIDELRFARQHLLSLPASPSDRDAFVSSSTGPYGGATRRLADILSEIQPHGYAFLAHPMDAASDPSGLTESAGPDMIPYSDVQLWRAFGSPAVLGLQLWNTDTRSRTSIGEGDSDERGFLPSWSFSGSSATYLGIEGFVEGELELQPYADEEDAGWDEAPAEPSLFSDLHHGAYAWDRFIRYGLCPTHTDGLDWVEPGEPRRFFGAGGSDAHGDLNYHRAGYMFGTDTVTDSTLGTPRNLVRVGSARACLDRPDLDVPDELAPPSDDGSDGSSGLERPEAPEMAGVALDDGGSSLATRHGAASATELAPIGESETDGPYTRPTHGDMDEMDLAPPDADPAPTGVRYCQEQVVDGLAEGRFSVTDGPALRIVVDRNRNGVIDDSDTPMGGVVDLYSREPLPLLVEWESTEEFGAVDHVDLYVGSVDSTMTGPGYDGRTYAPERHGVRRSEDPQGLISSAVASSFGTSHYTMEDNYWLDPTRDPVEGIPGLLRVVPGSIGTSGDGFGGLAPITLDLRQFPASPSRLGDRFYVRAFAITRTAMHATCLEADRAYYEDLADCVEAIEPLTRDMSSPFYGADPLAYCDDLVPDPEIRRRGHCHQRIAFTNPIWAMRRTLPSRLLCPESPRALDRDGDGLPDICDISSAVGTALR